MRPLQERLRDEQPAAPTVRQLLEQEALVSEVEERESAAQTLVERLQAEREKLEEVGALSSTARSLAHAFPKHTPDSRSPPPPVWSYTQEKQTMADSVLSEWKSIELETAKSREERVRLTERVAELAAQLEDGTRDCAVWRCIQTTAGMNGSQTV